jgi:hypothetical protein
MELGQIFDVSRTILTSARLGSKASYLGTYR